MNLFRSEEHIENWLGGRPGGATVPVTQLCDLAYRWWGDRLDPDWQPHTREHNQSILDAMGLTSDFWQLA